MTLEMPDNNVVVIIYETRNLRALTFRPPGGIAQSVTCLAADASLTADPGVGTLIPTQSHTFMK